jgi:peptide/nickel transport system substrate-binding protein
MKNSIRIGGLAAAILALSVAGTATAQEQDVTIVLNEEPANLDPCEAASDFIGRVALNNIFEALTRRDVETGEVLPALATGWEEGENNAWTFTLREGVTFHDGTPMTAASVKHALDRTLDTNLSCESRTKFFGDGDFGVEVVTDNAIMVTTPVRDPILPLKMSNMMIYPESVTMGEPVRTAPGTGPYVLGDWATGQHIVLERFGDYWGEQPSLEDAKFVWRSESSVRAAMVAQSEADFAPSIAEQDATDDIAVGYPNAETIRLNLDNLLPPLDDRRVREAINLALDRDGMLGTVVPASATKATQLYLPSVAGWSENVTMFPYDPERAKALIEEARADGVPVDTEIQLVGRIGHFPNAQEYHEVVAIMLGEIGLNVKLEWFEAAAKNKMQVKPFDPDRRPQIFVDQHDNTAGDPVFTIPSRWRSDGSQAKISDPELDNMIDEATKGTGEERIAKWKAAAEYIDTLLPDAMMFHMVGFAAIGDRIDYTPNMTTNSSVRLADFSLKP